MCYSLLVALFPVHPADNLCCISTEIVRAMTYVINQGMAMYWGTSRWTAMEIMVSSEELRVSVPCPILILK